MNKAILIKPSKPFFYSPGFILFVAILALLNNLEHSSQLYYSISKTLFPYDWMNWLYCIFVNLLIDLSVIAFVVNGRHKEAGMYAFLIFVINLLYYDGLGLFPKDVNLRIAYVTYSFMFTYSIYTFSKLYFNKVNDNEKKQDIHEALEIANETIHSTNETIIELNEIAAKKDNEIHTLTELKHQLTKANSELSLFKTNRLKELTCKECGHIAENDFGVSGHKKGCKSSKS